MATASLVRQIGTLFDGGTLAGLSDRQLLERFNRRRDDTAEAAFAALVARHGPMVLRVCRQVLGDHHLAEDAFQAAFLVLARKARSLRDPDRLGPWLYGVAVRTSRKARVRLSRHRRHEQGDLMNATTIDDDTTRTMTEPTSPPADQPMLDRDQAEILHTEIDRLPDVFRSTIVLCYFEGLALDEAARRLRCPAGTLGSRLARAREKLRRALTRRGFVLSTTALAAALEARPASASVPAPLCDATARAALGFAARQAAATTAALLAREVLRAMTIHRLKTAGLSLLLLATLSIGAGYYALAPSREGEPPGAPIAQGARQEPRPPDDAPHPAPGRMFVVGRVLDPSGRPMAGVSVDVIGRLRKPEVATRVETGSRVLIGRGETGADGRFRFDAMRTASTRFFEVDAIAAAPGFGLGWVRLNSDAEQPSAELRLQPEQIFRGRVVDINGQPAAGVELKVSNVGRRTDTGTFDGVNLNASAPPDGLRAWPHPVRTDERGRFMLAGIGENSSAGLAVGDPRFARQWLQVGTNGRRPAMDKDAALVLQPATIIEGRVLADDTGRPIPDAAIGVTASRNEIGDMYTMRFQADGEGRFTANPSPGGYFRVSAFPSEGQPYLVRQEEFAWNKGAVKRDLDLRLPRGVLIRGRVTDGRTGRPLAGATVQYLPARSSDGLISGWQAVVATGDDGSYQIATRPGKGHLFVYGPTSDYVLESIGSRMLYRGQPGGQRYYAHKIIPYDFAAGDRPESIAAALRPGKTVKGRVVGPHDETVDKAEIVALLHFNYFHLNWRGDLTIHVRDGRFELHGLDPEKPARVSFLDAEHEWGATVELSGQQAGEDQTVRLQPCGRAKARFVGPDGKPVARIFPYLEILGSPGPDAWSRDPKDEAMLAADAAYIVNLDRPHYWHGRGPLTGADGRITLPDLIPGATYRISDSSDRGNIGVRIRKDFTVKPGETLDLGDIPISKPPG